MIDPQNPDYASTPISPDRPPGFYRPGGGSGGPQVSIITPAFNTGPVFQETVTCIRRQSFQNYEWIIVDDGSTDPQFLSRLAELEAQDARVRVIHQENRGPGAARNRAVQEACADYICQLDSDDLIEPTFIEKCLWALISNPQYSFCNSYAVGFGDRAYLWPMGFERGAEFLQENRVSPHAVIRRAAHIETGGYDETIRHGHEDWDYWLNLAEKGHWGYTIPEYLLWYRWRANSRVWETLADPARHNAFRVFLRRKHAALTERTFPNPQPHYSMPFERVCDELILQNPLGKPVGRKRILMILPWMTMGGSDKFTLDLVAQLSGSGYDITIATTVDGPSPWLYEFARYTPDIFVLHHFLRPADFPRFLRYLIESRQIDIVFLSHSFLGYQLLPYLRSWCPDVTFVDYNHIVEEHWKNGGYPRCAVGYQELLDLNIVSSQHLKNWMVGQGADANRIEVCYTNIDPDQWNPACYPRAEIRRALTVPEATSLILYAGRLCEQKRPQLLVEIIRELAQHDLEFLCLVAGDGELRGFLEVFIRQHRLERYIRLLGAVSNQRIRELLAAADIFFLPSQWEGIALTLFEAMAMQVVPVAADVGGQRELVTPECGFLIPHGENESQEYVAVLKQLIESPELRASMGQAGRRRIIEHFTLDQMTKRMVDLLNLAQELSKSSPRPFVGRGLGLECATQAIEYTRLERLADHLWATHVLPAQSIQHLKTGREIAKRIYWRLALMPAVRYLYRRLSAIPGVRQFKSFVVRLLGIA